MNRWTLRLIFRPFSNGDFEGDEEIAEDDGYF